MIPNPFKHVVIDDFVAAELCRAACAEWPDTEWPHWLRYEGSRGEKYVTKDACRLTPACSEIVRELCRLPLSKLLQIEGTFPDLTLYGAGMSMILPGGDLPLHLDGDHHPITGWRRSASAVLYISDCAGGELQFWDAQGQAVVKAVSPRAARLVVFECTDQAWHSVATVQSGARLSINLFFWKLDEARSKHRPRAAFKGEKINA